VLGAKKLYDKTNVPDLVDRLRADGGVFQANHPSDGLEKPFTSCDQAVDRPGKPTQLHWKYGYDLQPDTIEVWNSTSLMTPSERYWECWLDRGAQIGATGGSDTHGATTPVLGMPTTWVFARRRDRASIMAALRSGRTTVSRDPPALGGARLLLEGDVNGDGKYESMIGDTVKPGSTLRVRAEGLPNGGLLRVRANGKDLVKDEPLAPGQALTLKAPKQEGWVRAVLYLPEVLMAQDPGCAPNESPVSICSHDLAVAAMTSPIYLGHQHAAPSAKKAPLPSSPPTELDSLLPLQPSNQGG
jgi:hypothetical protein